MNAIKNRKWIFAIVGIVLVMAIPLFVWQGMRASARNSVSNKLSILPEGTKTSRQEGLISGYSFAELSARSSLIVYGKVTDVSSPVILHDAFDGVSVYTDLVVEPETVLRGSADGPVTVRLSGGLSNGVYWDYAEVPELFLNEQYLLYLYQPGMGNGLYEEGDFYYLTGMYQGAFTVASGSEKRKADSLGIAKAEDDVLFVNTMADADSLTAVASLEQMGDARPRDAVLSLNTLKGLYPSFNSEHPIDPDLYRSEVIDAYNSNLKSGVITQEYYEELMASLDKYATVITEEEQEELAQAQNAEKQELLRQVRGQ